MSSLLVRNARILTMNDRLDVLRGAVGVRDGRIETIGEEPPGSYDRTVDAHGSFLLPGFIQTHVHLCQTLFRGLADDLPLMEWLRRRVWPLEAAHTASSLRASARLAAAELLQSGTTTVLTMETVHDTDTVCEAIGETGLRATIGKCLMDADEETPSRLRERTRDAIDESLRLHGRWHGSAGGRLRIAFAPRFALSCSRDLLSAIGTLSAAKEVLVHTHAAESTAEMALVRARTGLENVAYLASTGLMSRRLCAAHCIWVDEHAQQLLAEHDVRVLHCPGSNLKLGSGLAPVVELRARGVCVSLGADGAACNNRLDMFQEMRLASLIQAVRHEPGVLTARDVTWMATREGARALHLEHDIGSIEVGKRADLIVVASDGPHLAPSDDPYSTLVYAASGRDVRHTIVDGEVLVDDTRLVRMDADEIADTARTEASHLLSRAGI
jgi:5-methylthioadenosine/S-adenosylhomocysteine deaminase